MLIATRVAASRDFINLYQGIESSGEGLVVCAKWVVTGMPCNPCYDYGSRRVTVVSDKVAACIRQNILFPLCISVLSFVHANSV